MNDPRLGFITVTEVKVAEDLETAKVYVSVMGDETVQQRTLKTIAHARGHIQRLLADRLRMRRTPLLIFQHDEGIKKSVRVSALLRQLAAERSDRGADEPPAATGAPPEEGEAVSPDAGHAPVKQQEKGSSA